MVTLPPIATYIVPGVMLCHTLLPAVSRPSLATKINTNNRPARAADSNAAIAELAAYKAEVRAKTIAVGKAEIVLNEVCLAMVSRLGRVDGAQVLANKGRVMQEVGMQPEALIALTTTAFCGEYHANIYHAMCEILAR